MSTSLARQLQRLRTQQKDEIKLPKKATPSLLFDVADAKHIDENTLYPLALSGLDYLASISPAILQHVEILFSVSSKGFNRFTQTIDDLKNIDNSLSALLKLLAPYFMLPACHKVLEYLVRVYDIHIYHKELLIDALLPYMESAIFIKMAQLLNLKGHPVYGFLEPRIEKGNLLNKALLIQEICKSPKVLERICNFSNETANEYYEKFVVTIILQILLSNNVDKIQADHFRIILKYISDSLNQQKSENSISGILSISLQISGFSRISPEFINALFDDLISKLSTNPKYHILLWKTVSAAVQKNPNILTLKNVSFVELFCKNTEILAEKHKEFIEKYEINKYAIWLGKCLASYETDVKICEFIWKIKYETEKQREFLTGIIVGLFENHEEIYIEKIKNTTYELLKMIENKDIYAFCKWMQEFFAQEKNRTQKICEAFSGLKSFKAQYLVKNDSKLPIFPIHELSQNKTLDNKNWAETILTQLQSLQISEISDTDKKLYASVIKIICEEASSQNADTLKLLDSVINLKILRKVFDSTELLDIHINLCEELIMKNGISENYQKSFSQFCEELINQNLNEIDKNSLIYSKIYGILITSCLTPEISKISIKTANLLSEKYQNFKVFENVPDLTPEKIKEKIIENIVKNWENETLNLMNNWQKTYKMKCINNAILSDIFNSCLIKLKNIDSSLLNKILKVVNEFLKFFLKIQPITPWIATGITEIIKLLPDLDETSNNPNILTEDLKNEFRIIEEIFIYIISHSELQHLIAPLLNFHFKTQTPQFMLHLLQKNSVQSHIFISILTAILKGKTEISATTKLFLLFPILYAIRSISGQTRKCGIELVKSLRKISTKNNENPSAVHNLQEFCQKLIKWTQNRVSKFDAENLQSTEVLASAEKFLDQIIQNESEILADGEFLLSLMQQNMHITLCGYVIYGSQIIPEFMKFGFGLFIRAKHKDLNEIYLTALKNADFIENSIEAYKILVNYSKNYITEKHIDLINNIILKILTNLDKNSMKFSAEIHEILLDLLTKLYEISNKNPELESKFLILILSVLKNKGITTIKPQVQEFLEKINSEICASYLEKIDSMSKNSELVLIFESLLVKNTPISISLMKNTIKILSDSEKNSQNDEYLLELLFSFISKHIGNFLEFIEQYKEIIRNSFEGHLKNLITESENMSGIQEKTMRILNTEIYACINIPDGNSLYSQIAEVIEKIVKNSQKSSGFLNSINKIISLENMLIIGTLKNLRENMLLSYKLVKLYTSHIIQHFTLAPENKANLLLKWLPFSESNINKSNYISQILCSLCEILSISEKTEFSQISENSLQAASCIITRQDPEIILFTFSKICSLLYCFDGDNNNAFEDLIKINPEFHSSILKGMNKISKNVYQNMPKTQDKLKFQTLLFTIFMKAINEDTKIVQNCATSLNIQNSMQILAPGYTLLVLFYYKTAKIYKENLQNSSINIRKMHRSLIRNSKNFIENFESILSKSCICELCRILLNYKNMEGNLKSITRLLKIAVERTTGKNAIKGWSDLNSRVRFKNFIENAINCINEFSEQQKYQENTKEILKIQLLVAIINNGINMGMKEIDEEFGINILPKTMEKLLESEAIKSSLLFTTVYLCYSSLFMKFGAKLVLYAETLLNHLVKSATNCGKKLELALKDSEEYNSCSVIIAACLKTLNSLTESIPDFLDSHVSLIIKCLVNMPNIHTEIMLNLAENIGKKIPAKSVIFALAENYELYQHFTQTIQINIYTKILQNACQTSTPAWMAANYNSVFDLILILFPYSQFYYDLNKFDHPEISKIEDFLLEAFASYIIKLNSHQFKDIFINLVKWAQKVENSDLLQYNLRRCLIFIKSVEKLAHDTLHSLFIPHLPTYSQFLIELLGNSGRLCKNEQSEINFEKISYAGLMKNATLHVKTIFEKDTDNSIENETFQEIILPIIDQIEITQISKEYTEKILGDTLISMFDRINNEESWKYSFNIILMKTRSEESMIRFNAISILAQIVQSMQDKLLGLLSDIAPFAAECLEDENEKIVNEARKLLLTFEQITGESIDKFLH